GDWEPAASVIAEAISEHYTSARQMKDALSKLFPSRSEARKEVTGEKGAAEEASPVPFADFGRELKEFLDRDGKIAWQAGRDRVEADLKFVNLTEIKVEIRPTPEWLERYPDVREMLKANQSEEGLRPGRRAFGQFVLGRYRFEDGREALMIDEIQPGDGYRRLSQKRRRRLNPWRRLALRKMAEWAKSRNLVLLAMSDEVIKTVKRSMDEYEIETNYREPFKDSNQWEKHPLRLNRPFGPEGVRSWYVHRSSPAPIEMDRVSSLSQTERPALWVGLWNIVKSRITSGRSELRKKKTGEFEELGAFDGQRRRIHPANLTRLFQKTERFFKEEWAKTPMSIEFNSEGSILVRGPIREEDFRFVLDEIVDNARERNLGKGPVRVRLISDRQSAKILITNRGNIPWRELRRRALSGGIFRHKGSGLLLAGSIPAGWEARFKSLRPSEIKKLQRQRLLGVSGLTTNNLRNNGQGLYLTRRILRKWGARLKASSRKGQTTFSILFPLPSDTHSHSDHLRSANAASSPRSEVRSAPPRGLRRTGARAEVRNAVTHRAVVMDPNEDISGPAGGTLELSEALKGEPSLMLQLSPDTALRKGSLEALKKAFPQIESVRFTVFVSDKETGRMDPLARVIEAQAKRAHASNLKFFVEVLPARQIQGKDPKTWFPSGGTFRNMAIANWEARSVIHFIEILVQNFKINVDGLILPFPFNVTEHLHTRGDAKKLMRKLLQNAGETPLIWLQGRNPDLVVALELAENLALEIKQESKSKPVLLGYVTEVEGRDHVHFTGEIPFPRSEVRMMESKVSHSVEEAMRLDAEQFYLADKEPGMKPFIWPEDEKIQEDILNAAKGVPPGLPAIGLGTSELNHFAPSLISSVKFPRFDLVDLYPEATEEALRKRKQDDLIRQGKVHVIGTDLSMIAPEFYAKINKAIDSSSGAFAAIKELADLFESETEDGKVIRPDLPDPLKEREGSYGLVVSGMLLHHMSATFRQAILRRLRDRFRIPEKVILSLLAENPKFDHAVMNIQIQMMKAHAELVKKLLHPSGVGYVSSFIVRWDDKSRLPMAEREGKTRQVTPEWLAFDFGIIARIYQGAPSPAIGKEEAERRPSLLAQLSSADAASPGTTGVRWSIPWSLLNTSDSPWSQGTEQLHTSIRSSQGDRGLAQSLTFRLRPPRSEVRENDRKVSSSGLRVTGLTRGDNLEHVTSSSELPYSQRAEVRTEGRKVLDFIERQLRGGQGAERFLRKRGFVFGWREIDELLDRLGMGTLEAPFEIQHRRETFQVMTEKDLINRILFELDKNHRDHVYPAPAAKASLLARKIREKGKGALEVIAVNDGPEINPIQARVSGASRSGEPGRGKGFPWISTLVLSDELGYFEVITSREGLRFLPGALEPEPVSSRVQQGTFIRVVRFLSRERARRPLETQIGDWKGKKRRMKSVLLVGRENHVEPLDLDVLVLGSPPSKTLVTEVPEAKEASGKLAGASFDLIVLDGLSQGENHDLLAGLRTARETRPPPVILIGSPYSVPEKFADDPETFFIVGSMLTGVTQNVGKVIEALQAKPLRSEARAGKVIQPLKMTPVSHRRFVRNILKEHPFEKHRLQVDMSPDLDHWDGRLVALWNYPENADRRWPNSLLSLYWLRGRKILQIPIPGKDQGSIPVGWTSTVPRAWYRVYSTPNGLRLVTMNEANRVSLFKINFSSDVPAAVRIPLAGKLFFQARVSIGDEEYRVETEGAGETLVVAREVSRKGEESENRFDFSNGSLIENSSSSSRSEPRAEVRGEEKRAEVLKELVRQSKQLVETKKMLYDGPELLEFYRTLVRLLKAAGLFRDHTIISPAGGIDGVFAAEGVDTVLLNDGDKSGLARKLVKEHWKSPEPLNDHLRYVSGTDVRKVRRYDEWTGTIRTSHRTLLFKGIRNYVFRAEPQEFERYLQAIDQYLKPGDRILFLNYLDIQDSRHFFLGTHDGRYRLVEDWLPGGGMTELKRAVQRMHEHFLVPSMDYKHNLLIPNGFLLIEKMGSDRAWLAGPEVRKAEMQSDVRRSETRTVENPDRVNSDLVRFFLEELMKNEEMRALFEKLKAGLENSTEAAKPPDAKQHFNYLKRYFVDRQSYQAIQPENPAQVKEYVSRDIKRLGRLSEMHAFRERVLQAVEKLARDQALSREQADLFKTRFNVGAPESRTENETLDLVNRGRGSVVSRARLQNSVDFVARKLKEAFGIPEVRPVLSLEAEQEIKGLLLELRPEEVRIVVERLKGIDSKRLLSGYPVSQEDLKLFWMWFGPKQKGPVQMKEQKLVRNIEEAQQRIRNLLYYLEKHLLERTAEGHFKWKEPLPARVDGSISTAAVKSLLKYRLISVLELEILLRSQEGYQAVPTLERDLLILKTYFYGVPSDIRAATKKSTFHAIIQSWLGRLAEDPFVRGRFKRIQQALKELAQEDSVSGEILRQLLEGRTQPDAKNRKALEKALTRLKEIVQRDNPRRVRIMFKTLALLAGGRTDRFLQIAERLVEQAREKRGQAWTRGRKPEWEKALSRAFQKFLKGREFTREERGRLYELETRFAEIKLEVKPLKAATAAWERPVDGDEPPGPGRGKLELTDEEEDLKEEEDDPEWREKFLEDIAEEGDRSEVRQGGISFLRLGPEEVEALRDPEKAETRQLFDALVILAGKGERVVLAVSTGEEARFLNQQINEFFLRTDTGLDRSARGRIQARHDVSNPGYKAILDAEKIWNEVKVITDRKEAESLAVWLESRGDTGIQLIVSEGRVIGIQAEEIRASLLMKAGLLVISGLEASHRYLRPDGNPQIFIPTEEGSLVARQMLDEVFLHNLKSQA
ncbi:MAG: ATP-binding protein, partial [Candidatus Omnitrophica bacterium]|nr:ATP-binding protein [Candidatus Omnitrophota bacterium]